MPISLLDIPFVANSRFYASNSENTSSVELLRINNLQSLCLQVGGGLIYPNTSVLPQAGSHNSGQFAFVESANSYVFSTGTEWASVEKFVPTYEENAGAVFGYGYNSGGYTPTATNVIDKFPFVSDGNATDVGDLTTTTRYAAGQSSAAYGYSSGGWAPSWSTGISKFPFATDANATHVGDLRFDRADLTGQSSSTYGYASGGIAPPQTKVTWVDRFPFAADVDATGTNNLSVGRYRPAGQNSSEYGYTSGGAIGAPPAGQGEQLSNVIDKFPFASSGIATDVGNLTATIYGLTGQSSTDYGYSSGGLSPSISNIISKFSFASDGNASDVGDLAYARWRPAGQNSSMYGYTSGGWRPDVPGNSNVIDKFPFATDDNATDVGDLTLSRSQNTGQSYK